MPFGASADSTIVRVSSVSELTAALAGSSKGLHIELAAGEYGTLSLRDLRAPANAPLVLRSQNPARPARLTGLQLKDAKNVVFEDLIFDYQFKADDARHLRPFRIRNSTNITIRNVVFDGDLAKGVSPADDGYGYAVGLGVNDSQGVRLENNQFFNFHRGMTIYYSSEVTIAGNDIYAMRSDGINFAQVSKVRIEGNHIHDFATSSKSGDHADMIQFWTKRTKAPSRDIVIRNNVLNSGQGQYTQSIFMRNEEVDQGRAGRAMFYRNITIENNVIINAHLHGITVGETDGLAIRNNTVVRNPASQGGSKNLDLWTPKILVAQTARNVEIVRNVTSAIDGAKNQADWRIANNVLVQDRSRRNPFFYGAVFVPDVLHRQDRLSSFMPLLGGPLDGAGIGAARLFRKP